MLNALIRGSLRHRVLVLVISALVMLGGWHAARQMPPDVLPELNKPIVTVLTECGTLAPADVEAQVTRPLEAALLGAPGLERLRSESDTGLSVVFLEFDWGTDLRQARLLVQERLMGVARQLPESFAPGLAPATSLMGEVLLVGLSSTDEKVTPAELRRFAETVVRRRLQSIPGVADVLPMGGGVPQIHMLLDPRRMAAHQLTFEEVQSAVANATGNATAGVIHLNSREMAVRTLGLTSDLAELRRTPVKIEDDHVILVGDIARVEHGTAPMRGDASVNGQPGVILSIDKAPGADTLRVTAEVERALEELRPSLPAGAQWNVLFRQGDFIESAIGNLKQVVRDGALVVAAVLLLFLVNLRATVITLTAIPLSFAVSFLVFRGMGVGMNTMTLGGLAVAIGLVVDDAIVDVENVFRRWRENRRLAKPRPLLEVVAAASSEVRGSIFYATVLVLLTFLPLLALPGLEGQLFAPVLIAACVSIAASFLVSLTVIPVLCSLVLRGKARLAMEARDPVVIRGLKALVSRTALRWALGRPFLVLGITAVLLATAGALFSTLPRSFLPAFQENSATVSLVSAPGTSLYATSQIGETAVRLLQRVPEIRSIGRRTGRAERDDHLVPVSVTEFDLEFHSDGRPRAAVVEEIRQLLGGIPGTFVNIGAPIAHRLSHMLSGTTAKLAIKISGADVGALRETGEKVAEIARGIPGLVDVMLEPQTPTAQIAVEVDRERALAYGLQTGALNQQVTGLLSGRVAARIPDGEQSIDLLVKLAPEWSDTPEELASLPLVAPTGQILPLRAVADVRETTASGMIRRENGQPRVIVTANASGEDWPSLVARLDATIRDRVELPAGVSIRYEGEYAAQQAAVRQILLLSGVVLLLFVVLLYGYFRSGILVAQVLVNVPLALMGGVLLTWLMGGEMSIAALVGLIAVGGIATRNGVLMLSHYLHLLRHEGEVFGRDMVIRGTLDRIPPVLMTALSTALALLPLVIAGEQPGRELLHPVAVVMVGGLLASTLLDFCVTPAVFYHFGGRTIARALLREGCAAGSALSAKKGAQSPSHAKNRDADPLAANIIE